jgi:hypothetical protein
MDISFCTVNVFYRTLKYIINSCPGLIGAVYISVYLLSQAVAKEQISEGSDIPIYSQSS